MLKVRACFTMICVPPATGSQKNCLQPALMAPREFCLPACLPACRVHWVVLVSLQLPYGIKPVHSCNHDQVSTRIVGADQKHRCSRENNTSTFFVVCGILFRLFRRRIENVDFQGLDQRQLQRAQHCAASSRLVAITCFDVQKVTPYLVVTAYVHIGWGRYYMAGQYFL